MYVRAPKLEKNSLDTTHASHRQRGIMWRHKSHVPTTEMNTMNMTPASYRQNGIIWSRFTRGKIRDDVGTRRKSATK